MMKKFFLFLFLPLSLKSQKILSDKKECPPCEIIYNDNNIKEKLDKWPKFSGGDLLKINSLTKIQYEKYSKTEYLYYEDEVVLEGFKKGESFIDSWWTYKGLDPWSSKPYWGEYYKKPSHSFKSCVNDNLRWMCGYSYVVDIPNEYDQKKKYPLVIYLHGSVWWDNEKYFISRDQTRRNFFRPKGDPYIFVAPIKLEIDWSAKKMLDLINNISENLNIDSSRIYLTGLSMGGRGSFIVASELQNMFASLLVLSPHHGPRDYIPLAKKIKDIPIWIDHGEKDMTSSYLHAKKMADTLKKMNSKIKFVTNKEKGHYWSPDFIYRDSTAINWMLSWKK